MTPTHRPAHQRSCALAIRRRMLADTADEDHVPGWLRDQVAAAIAACCGHPPLKCYRLANGWTIAAALEQFHTMCEQIGIKRRGLTDRSWREWEAGGRPDRDYEDLLCRLFQTDPVRLGFARDYSPARDVIGDTADRARRHALGMAVTEVGPGLVEHLHTDVAALASSAVTAPPFKLFTEIATTYRHALMALDRKAYPGQQRDLLLLAGALCGLMANVSIDLGRITGGSDLAHAAWTYGTIAGHPAMVGWADGLQALAAMAQQHYDQAADHALRGLTHLPGGAGARRLHAIAARALAYGGHPDQARQQLISAANCDHPDDLERQFGGEFVFPPPKVHYYEAVTRGILGDQPGAETLAEQAIAGYQNGPPQLRSYGCESLARLQLAQARLLHGDIAAATEAFDPVLAIEPPYRIHGITDYVRRTRQLLARSPYHDSVEARELTCQLDAFCAARRPLPAATDVPNLGSHR